MDLKVLEKAVNGDTKSQLPNGETLRRLTDGHEVDLCVDTETGVQYFVMNHGNAGAICPRYKADGSLYTVG